MVEIYCIGVSRTWHNRGNIKHTRAKKELRAYFVTGNGRFFTKSVSKLEALSLRTQIKRRILMVCSKCGSKFYTFKHLVMDFAEGKRVCPICRK